MVLMFEVFRYKFTQQLLYYAQEKKSSQIRMSWHKAAVKELTENEFLLRASEAELSIKTASS